MIENEEVWRDIEDYEGQYQVSNFARVKSLNYKRSGKEGILKGGIDTNGYHFVSLFKNRKQKHWSIHQLVARAFPEICGEWFEGCQVDHINTIKNDNRPENLKVCTPTVNMNNPLTKQKISRIRKEICKDPDYIEKLSLARKKNWEDPEYREKHSQATKEFMSNPKNRENLSKKLSKPIYQLDKDTGEIIKKWSSGLEAEKTLGISASNITKCCKGKKSYKTVGGYKWMYA